MQEPFALTAPCLGIPANYKMFLGNGAGLPVAALDQEGKILVAEVLNLESPGSSNLACKVVCRNPSKTGRSDFFEVLITNDSSNPTFLLMDDQPVLLSIHWTRGPVGSSIRMYFQEINDAMKALSPELDFQLEEVDFSGFPTLPEEQ